MANPKINDNEVLDINKSSASLYVTKANGIEAEIIKFTGNGLLNRTIKVPRNGCYHVKCRTSYEKWDDLKVEDGEVKLPTIQNKLGEEYILVHYDDV